jgi:nucleoside-diphosphate-sugar epimerase
MTGDRAPRARTALAAGLKRRLEEPAQGDAMRIVVIGGTGHVGTYLVPRLVQAGHETIVVSRRLHAPYRSHPAWQSVRHVEIDRIEAEADGRFGDSIAELAPDAVVDMICFTPASARQLVEALRGRVRRFIHCGTIWVHGHSVQVPTDEAQPREPFGDYGIRKAEIEAYLLEQAQQGFPASVLHPGHIVGPGWVPVNPAGNFDPAVFSRLARGDELLLPNLGMETLHHVHADDVAQAFVRAFEHWDAAVGESFHVVSAAALTLRGYAEAVASWFGRAVRLCFLPWDEWRKTVAEDQAAVTWDHIAHSPNCSIAKARRLLGYDPRYSSLEAVREAVEWLIENGGLVS